MTDAEKAVLVKFVKDMELLIPELIAAEAAKLPAQWAPLAGPMIQAVLPSLMAALDKKIQEKLG
jgi:hypothetical protein